jgi:receptor protein-tyrosine kinase
MKDLKPSLVERAALRLDLRSITTGPIRYVAAPAKPPAEPESLAADPIPPVNGGVRSGGLLRAGALSERPPRQPAKHTCVAFDRARLRELALVDWAGGRTRVAEEFRIIKRQFLEQAANPQRYGPRSNLIMITSGRAGEGRTFTALNLAISMAMERNWQVLLLDACDGSNAVASVVQTRPELGWLDLVEDPALDVSRAILETDIPRLSLMLPGPRQGCIAEPLASENMQRMLEELSASNHNRVVLIDVPPCLDSSDPSTLARVVGQTGLIVEAHTTQQQGVEDSLELLRACVNTYLILNKSRVG